MDGSEDDEQLSPKITVNCDFHGAFASGSMWTGLLTIVAELEKRNGLL